MTVSKEHKDLPLVPESVLKRRHDLDDLQRKKQANLEEHEKKNQNKRGPTKKGTYVKKPETLLALAKNRRNEHARYRRVKKKGMMKRASKKPEFKTQEMLLDTVSDDEEDTNIESQTQTVTYQSNSVGAPYVFCIRIREDAAVVPRNIFSILLQLRLKQPNTGVFLKYDAVTRRKLHLVEPWVVYGFPSEGIVKDLMERKSFGYMPGGKNGEKVPLSDNTILEKALGEEHGILCMEDLVHELTTVGDGFDAVTTFLVPFPLTAARSRFEKEKLQMKQGKDYGDKGQGIDEYIKHML